MRILSLIWVFLYSANILADDVYYLNNLSYCQIQMYQDKALVPVSDKRFINVLLKVKKLPRNPSMVAFKSGDRIYVTQEICVMSAGNKKIDNGLTGNEYRKRPQDYSTQDKFNGYKYFAEIDLGTFNVNTKSPVASDYNEVFPSSETNPTFWSEPAKSSYKAGSLISLGGGIRSSKSAFLAFKLRLLSGKKTDSLSLMDVNTSAVQTGEWEYQDSFKNIYAGYKFMYMGYERWKPVAAGYLGLSYMTSTLSDGASSYELSSLGVAAMIELGMEYQLNSHWTIGALLGYEHLGQRSLSFSDKDSGVDFKTNMNYTNKFLTIGAKYYFK